MIKQGQAYPWIKQLLKYKRSNKVTYGSGSQCAVVQLDDTGRGMSGNIRHPEGCVWKKQQKEQLRRWKKGTQSEVKRTQ